MLNGGSGLEFVPIYAEPAMLEAWFNEDFAYDGEACAPLFTEEQGVLVCAGVSWDAMTPANGYWA